MTRLLPTKGEAVAGVVKTGRDALVQYLADKLRDLPAEVRDWYRGRHSITVDLGTGDLPPALFLFLAHKKTGDTFHAHYRAMLTNGPVDSGVGTPKTEPADRSSSQEKGVAVGPAPARRNFVFTHEGIEYELERETRHETISEGHQKKAALKRYRLRAWHATPGDVRAFLQDAVAYTQALNEDEIAIHILDTWENWTALAEKTPRTLKDVAYPLRNGSARTLGRKIVEEGRTFFTNHDWYQTHGVPWRRTYLFYGPPGTGKSTCAEVLAGELQTDLYQISVGQGRLDDDALMGVLQRTDPRSIILIEDVDEAVSSDTMSEDSVTYRGLSNALDGVAAQEGRITVLTTNRREEIDERLLRSERVHAQVYFGLCTPGQAQRLYEKFFPNHPGKAERVKAAVSQLDDPPSPAEIQKVCRQHRKDPTGAVKEITKWMLNNTSVV